VKMPDRVRELLAKHPHAPGHLVMFPKLRDLEVSMYRVHRSLCIPHAPMIDVVLCWQ
jgi:hypothetical protein